MSYAFDWKLRPFFFHQGNFIRSALSNELGFFWVFKATERVAPSVCLSQWPLICIAIHSDLKWKSDPFGCEYRVWAQLSKGKHLFFSFNGAACSFYEWGPATLSKSLICFVHISPSQQVRIVGKFGNYFCRFYISNCGVMVKCCMNRFWRRKRTAEERYLLFLIRTRFQQTQEKSLGLSLVTFDKSAREELQG